MFPTKEAWAVRDLVWDEVEGQSHLKTKDKLFRITKSNSFEGNYTLQMFSNNGWLALKSAGVAPTTTATCYSVSTNGSLSATSYIVSYGSCAEHLFTTSDEVINFLKTYAEYLSN